MHEEDDFLRKLLDDPADETARLVYADWLDERGDPASRDKAHFLRLTVRSRQPRRPKRIDEQLQELAAKLDTDWLTVVSRLRVENCRTRRLTDAKLDEHRRQFSFLCDRTWDEMTPTADAAVRHCEACDRNVHYCDTIVVARRHAAHGRCVALDLGVIRRPGDLFPRRVMIRGRINIELVRQIRAEERERNRPDPVSEERERRKREQRQSSGEQE